MRFFFFIISYFHVQGYKIDGKMNQFVGKFSSWSLFFQVSVFPGRVILNKLILRIALTAGAILSGSVLQNIAQLYCEYI